MLHARRRNTSSSLLSSPFSTQAPTTKSLSDLLLAASLSKSLSSPKPNADADADISSPLPDSVLVHLLRLPSLSPSTKLSLFEANTRKSNANANANANSCFNANAIVDAASALLLSLSRSALHLPHLLPALRLSLPSVSPAAFRSVLDALLRSSRFDDAIAALDLASPHPLLHTPHTYSSVVLALLRHQSHLPLALSLFRRLLSSPSTYPTSSSCNRLLVALYRSDMQMEFRQLFDELSHRDFPFDSRGYNILIHFRLLG